MTDTDFRAAVLAEIRKMYPQPEFDFSKPAKPQPEAEPERVEAEPKAQDDNGNTDPTEPEAEVEPEPEYFVRNNQNERLTTDQFNHQESMRWLADHLGLPQQTQHEPVAAGHYASDDVSDEEFAEAYARHTGTAYRKRSHVIKSNRPL
ncbi:hypothetical protein ACIOFV_50245 [Streptomyces mirabilis]|uniref:hypothetical protein n=1 Tax=Streptomyces mirabilis TaxID=68239 RepID=UPI0038036ED1